ncbi:hypothetical protein OKW30_008305 [Paraburkholderia sp. Clong3]|uniref:hypothetical protein n=1 Tax=Paraburkholderia sp. Clong3 TaxID=2991061 RepID=UPI003D1FD24F
MEGTADRKNSGGCPEIHYTRIYRGLRRWEADGCIDRIFAGSVRKLHQDGPLDLTVIHGDGTTTAAKKGGDNLGYSGHKQLKGDKVVAFCDRHCNVIGHSLPLRAPSRNDTHLRIARLVTAIHPVSHALSTVLRLITIETRNQLIVKTFA